MSMSSVPSNLSVSSTTSPYRFTHKIEFLYEYTYGGETHKGSIDYCSIKITDENYEGLEEFAKDSEVELANNPNEEYYSNFVKIIQEKHNFNYPNPNFIPLDEGLTDEDYYKFVRIFRMVYSPLVINKPPDYEFIKRTIAERNRTELKNLNFEKDVVITRIVYKRTNFRENENNNSNNNI